MHKFHVTCENCENDDCLIKKHSQESFTDEIEQHKVINRYTKDQLIFHEGNPTDGIYFVQSGKIKVFKNGAFNKDQIVRLTSNGEILGHRGFGRENNYPVSAKSITDSQICFFEKDYFFDLLEKSPKLTIDLMLFYANELNNEESKLRDMAIFNVREKVAKAILFIADSFGLDETNEILGSDILTRQDIAETVGLTPNQVTKVLTEFKQDELIATQGKKIKILKPQQLKNMIEY